MTKEKQIEEMARTMCNCYDSGYCKMHGNSCDLKCISGFNALGLYNAGYRRYDDLIEEMTEEIDGWKKHYESLFETAKAMIREEVAREIFEEIEDILNNIGYFDEIDFKTLKKKYTEGEG